MADEFARRAHAVFVEALGLDDAERERLLADRCAGDAALHQRVRRLLGAVPRSTTFLEVPALGPAHPVPVDPGSISVRGYRLVRVIGVGGMATVYEAEQAVPKRTVALKVMNRALASTSAVDRFRYETEVLARLQHPGIAQIFEAGTCDDGSGRPLPFFAMELVPGAKTIVEHARGLPLERRLAVFAGVCDAVEHGHQQGIIHRDLKPANILVDGEGRTKVIDFGVARPADPEHPGLTRVSDARQMIGTLNAMSPEQCAGDGPVDVRTDIYSLGVILYEMVGGRLPHDLSRASITEAARIIAEEAPARLGSIAHAAKGDLEAIVARAMEKEPGRRYGSAGSLAADVRRFLLHQPIEARPPTTFHQLRMFARRNRLLVASAGAIALALLASSIAVGSFAYRTSVEAGRRLVAEQEAIRERDIARREAYAASISGAFLSAQAAERTRARRYLDAAPASLRHWEWWLVAGLTEGGERTIHAHDAMAISLALGPGTHVIASGASDGTLSLWDSRDGGWIASGEGHERAITALAFSPSGEWLAAGAEDGLIQVLDGRTGELERRITHRSAPVHGLAWLDDGRLAIAYRDAAGAGIWDPRGNDRPEALEGQEDGVRGVARSADGGLISWGAAGSICLRTADGRSIVRPLDMGAPVECAAVSPDGSWLAAGSGEGRVRVWNLRDGELRRDFATPRSVSTVRAIAFSPDGRTLTTGQVDRSIRLFDLDRMTMEVLSGHDEAVSGLAYVASGDWLVSSSWDGTVRLWPRGMARGPEAVRVLEGHAGHVLGCAFEPGGRLIASASRDRTVRVWDAVLGRPLAVLRGHEGGINAVAFTPDGGEIVTGADDGTVRRWSALDGSEGPPLRAPDEQVVSVDVAPDGSRIAAACHSGRVLVWDARTGQEGLSFLAHGARINHIRFSRDGLQFATASRDGTVRVWRTADGSPVHSLEKHRMDVFALAFSPDGTRLFSGSRDQTTREWELATGREARVLPSPGQFITSLSLTPDGRRLATGSWFSEVTIWDAETGQALLSFEGYDSAVRSVEFSPDGWTLVVAGVDGTLRLFHAAPIDERRSKVQSAHEASERAAAVIGRLAARALDPRALLDAAAMELGDDQEARRWAQNLVLESSAGRDEEGTRRGSGEED